MRVEQTHLRDSRRAYEARVFIELWAGFHATGAGDAAGDRISLLLFFGRHARAGAEVVSAVDGNPGFDDFKIFEDHAAVGRQIAHDGELGKWFELYRLFEIVDQSGASHARASVDEHGARAADFLEAIRVVGDGRGRLAVASDGVGGDLHERGYHVHARMPGELKLFPVGIGSGVVLALDFYDYGFMFSHLALSL